MTAAVQPGQRFGRLIALRPRSNRRRAGAVWSVWCDCGAFLLLSGHELTTKNGGRVMCARNCPSRKAGAA